jgi:hypothetical protein
MTHAGGHTAEENNGYVVFIIDIHGSAGKKGGGEEGCVTPPAPTPFIGRLLDGY